MIAHRFGTIISTLRWKYQLNTVACILKSVYYPKLKLFTFNFSAQSLYGVCVPFFSVATIIANTLVVIVLTKRHMRTPINAVLMAIAISDMLTVAFPTPWLLYFYTFGYHYKPFYPPAVCYIWAIMNETIPNLFHTASIWLTVALAVQRYIGKISV